MSAEQEPALHVAAIQMDAESAPTADRLERAESLVDIAVDGGARLVLLPELFSTGYAFTDENHIRVETIDGPTVGWLRQTAARQGIHLAGSLMLLEGSDVYNALLLFAPDGRSWRYDKNYPWGWEQGYFRPSRRASRTTVADTDIGALGMLICWDVAHPGLWKEYAGRVDLMLISSCPVDAGHATYHLPDGQQFSLADLGPIVASSADGVTLAFGDMIDQQTAWLGVPTVHATMCGRIRTPTPMGRRVLLGYALVAPWMLKHYRQADGIEASFDLLEECKILDGRGRALTRLSNDDGEAAIVTSVDLVRPRSTPRVPQPASLVSRANTFVADTFLPRVVKPVYRKGKRRRRDT